MTAVNYVKACVDRDYPEHADYIKTFIDDHMDILLEPEDMTAEEKNSEMQKLLDAVIYPFFACMRAMEDVGIDEDEANRYCTKIWNVVDAEMRRRREEKKHNIC